MSPCFAVIGNPIAHSLSPFIHQHFAQQTKIHLNYEKIMGDDVSFETQVSDFFSDGGLGLNVTLPFKQRAFALATVHSARCQKAGAANTLWMKENQLHADNTDGVGLIRDMQRYTDLQSKNILILGAGGAVRGILEPLLAVGSTQLTIANRTLEKAKALTREFPEINCISLADLSSSFDLIINATSASLADNAIVLPAELMSRKPFCYDLAYKAQSDTAFIHSIKSQGCLGVDGLGMLVEQAAEAFYLWHGVRPKTEAVLSLLRHQSLKK